MAPLTREATWAKSLGMIHSLLAWPSAICGSVLRYS